MLKIGLTGGIGSGKSTIAKVFEEIGVPVFYADLEAKKLLILEDIKHDLLKQFGADIFDENDQVIRAKLAEIVFNSQSALQQLNQLIHPKLMEIFNAWCGEKKLVGYTYVLQEAAILFEAGFNTSMDKVICVTAPQELRISRVVARDKVSKEEVIARINNQWPQSKIVERSDYVLSNGATDMVLPRIMEIHAELML